MRHDSEVAVRMYSNNDLGAPGVQRAVGRTTIRNDDMRVMLNVESVEEAAEL